MSEHILLYLPVSELILAPGKKWLMKYYRVITIEYEALGYYLLRNSFDLLWVLVMKQTNNNVNDSPKRIALIPIVLRY